MNICKFEIILSKESNTVYLNELLQKCFKSSYSKEEEFISSVTKKYNERGDVFKSLYPEKLLQLYRRIGNIEYFLFSKDEEKMTDKITNEIVFFTEDNNIGICINKIFKDLKKKCKEQKLKISYTDNTIIFYLNEKKDVVHQDIRIRAGFDNKAKFSWGDIIRYIIFGSSAIISFILFLINFSDKSLKWSILSVMLAFVIPLITELLINIFSGKKVIIHNFSQWFEKEEIESDPYDSGQQYSDPDVPEGESK